MTTTNEEVFDQEFSVGDERTVLSGKYLLDGATNMDEAIQLVKGYAEHLEYLKTNGFEIEGVVDDDYGLARIVR